MREDLEKLPEGTGIDEYTDMPVEGFGAALLSGYGLIKDRALVAMPRRILRFSRLKQSWYRKVRL